jgi:hypothetical protein
VSVSAPLGPTANYGFPRCRPPGLAQCPQRLNSSERRCVQLQKGCVGTFAIQFAGNARARVMAKVREAAAVRRRGYGAVEIVKTHSSKEAMWHL